MRVQRDEVVPLQHFPDPDNRVRAGRARVLDCGGHFAGDVGRIRSAGAEDHLCASVHVADGIHQVDDALLAGDAPDEQHIRHLRVDAVRAEHRRIWRRPILLEIDPVVDDADAVERNTV
jgi:hypothetical protein